MIKGYRPLAKLLLDHIRKRPLDPLEISRVQNWLKRSAENNELVLNVDNEDRVWQNLKRMHAVPTKRMWDNIATAIFPGSQR